MKSVIFFDMWNTLVYCPTKDHIKRALEETGYVGDGVAKILRIMDETIFVDERASAKDVFATFAKEEGLEAGADALEKACNIWNQRFENARVFDETFEVLDSLGRDYRLGLVTNTDSYGKQKSKELGIAEKFDYLTYSCDVGCSKPCERIFKHALKLAAADARECWMVGDNIVADVRASEKLGFDSILIDRIGKYFGKDRLKAQDLRQVEEMIRR